MAGEKKAEPREEFGVFEKHLMDNGLKRSRQREVILEYFLRTEGHMTVDHLYRIIVRSHPEIGRTTVYRALKLFCDAGLAEAIELKDGLTRFEHRYNHEHHDHMICTECGDILEFTSEHIEKLQEEIARKHSFVVESHRHQIFGKCGKCNEARRAKSRSGYRSLSVEPTPPMS